MFSTILIHNCGSIDGEPTTITLKASPSFPAALWYQQDWERPVPATWAAKDVSGFDGTLEIKLVERISEGRIGITYVAQVISATQSGSDVRSTIPSTLCLKFAKPEFSRSLAREAWFYEQLESLQGISVPLSFGFFASTASEQPKFPGVDFEFEPWTDRQVLFEDTDSTPDNIDEYPSPDWLTDDVPEYYAERTFEHTHHELDSPWYQWSRNLDDNPTISVLVLELLGEPCTGRKTAADKHAIHEVMDDLAAVGVVHDNLTPWNTLAFKPSPQSEPQLCPRHGVVHPWRIIDFDRSKMADPTNLSDFGCRNVLDTEYVLDIAVSFNFWAWR
ncbi:protein kinase subdomain-containing protein PKL/ccin3 [Coprinopsis cinerea okayama7|uniref:Protein kinase subdomain-containing protein PKL/ccin3 n=1 Tax=Coprinopsis cinerea (strain Okayama-7 / 130 / ATCC MYA-4618 / FGSC 9003) TaxID=240176 RepID=A8NDB5_COPC7|nr:protein kinase subdomain-containing protein PKL/ccin3 [Coprinopsis cinerea okayama7\|eukprot:XP_001832737.1 protein kinase subdomain-containing protein PKL/ccin3 [Coprinopsis cinerea okayama7\